MIKQQPHIVRSVKELRETVRQWRSRGETVSMVPTMGALHQGHLSLVELARREARRCVVSIFVNPKQFGPNEDLAAYPRDEAGDVGKLASLDTDLVFAPGVADMYPSGFTTRVTVSGVSEGLCGASRPGHFDGVATVVCKLLLQCLPDVAVFGEKDFQQLMVIRRLVTDLDIPVRIVGAPVKREDDGLAMSSRNAYLSTAERSTAPLLHATLQQAAAQLQSGSVFSDVEAEALVRLRDAGFVPDYFELHRENDLSSILRMGEEPARLLVAARLGRTRLIDNVRIDKADPMV